MTRHACIRSWSGTLVLGLTLAAAAAPPARGQSVCSSDRQTQPARLLERFISADCDACWADGTIGAGTNELALDWIVPGSKGQDAALSAAASLDAPVRLEALGRTAPAAVEAIRSLVQAPRRGLRVSHGLAFNGYVGTSIELKSPGAAPWSAWLLLVETIPAGTEGTAIERNLVRNALQAAWTGAAPPSQGQLSRLHESRPMSIPEGVRPERLSVVGWVQDGRGRIRAIAQSRCAAAAPGG